MNEAAITGKEGVAGFNIEEDWKAKALASKGRYKFNLTGMKFDDRQSRINVALTIVDSGKVLSDESTPADGYTLNHMVFLPMSADVDVPTKGGGQTKWQWKVIQLKQFFHDLLGDSSIKTIEDIQTAMAEGRFIGKAFFGEVTVEVIEQGSSTGQLTNKVNKLEAIR